MAGIGIILAWLGYSVFYYGYDTVTGGNDTFVSLIWPGRYTPTARDGGGSSGGGSSGQGSKKSNPICDLVPVLCGRLPWQIKNPF